MNMVAVGVVLLNLAVALGDVTTTPAYDIEQTFTGSATISFEPDATATVPVNPDDLTLKCVLTIEGTDPVYEVVGNGEVEMTYNATDDKWTIDAGALEDVLSLKDYDIGTYEKYQAYAQRVKATKIVLTISEDTPAVGE